MSGTASGLIIATIARIANASFALPMKFARRWAWENVWPAWTFFALLLLPIIVAFLTIPSLGAVYRDAGTSVITIVMICGAGWAGAGGLAFPSTRLELDSLFLSYWGFPQRLSLVPLFAATTCFGRIFSTRPNLLELHWCWRALPAPRREVGVRGAQKAPA